MENPQNPYQPNADTTLALFAGRQAALARLHLYLEEPVSHAALLFLGQRRAGKTALLQRFDAAFDPVFIGVYVALRGTGDLWQMLADASEQAIAQRDLTLSRLPERPATPNLYDWLAERWLPEVLTAIRAHRRLVWLLDDADSLLDQPGEWERLYALLSQQPRLKLVLTANTEQENRLVQLDPLIDVSQIFRLENLSRDESDWLLREPVRGLYTLSDSAAQTAYDATGGQPQLVQRCGSALYALWEADPSHTALTPKDVKAVLPQVGRQSAADFQALWEVLNGGERRLLTAISRLSYEDPLQPVSIAALTVWFIDSNDPLDSAAIHAGIRSLEYRQIVRHEQGRVTLATGLLQPWLLEHAAPEAVVSAEQPPRLILGLLLAAIIIVLLLISQMRGPEVPVTQPEPTVTLAGG